MAPGTGPRNNENTGIATFLLKPREESILMICGMLLALIFILDISLVIGFVVSILYVVPVLMCIWSPRRRTIFLVAGVATVLTLVAVPLKPSGELLLPLFNRPLSLIALWTVALLVDWFTYERKRSEEALRESEERFQTMADGSPNLIWVSDAKGKLMFSNRASRSFFGRKLAGISDEEWLGFLHPDDAKAYYDKFLHALHTHEPFVTEARNRRSDGAWRWMEAHVEPRFSDDGAFLGFVGTSVDITDRREAEEALRESEERLLMAQQLAHIGTFEWNIQTGKNVWTPELEAMYGLPSGEFPGTQPAWESLVHPDDREEAIRKVNEAIEKGSFEGEWRVVWPDGSVHWLQGRGWVFKDEQGRPLKLLGVNIDDTERKIAQRSIEESRRNEQARRRELEALMDAVPATIWISRDSDGTNMAGNKATEILLGVPPGSNVSETAPLDQRQQHFLAYRDGKAIAPSDLPMQEAGRTGKAVEGIEFEMRFDDGRSVWLYGNAVPLKELGKTQGAVGAFVDITERKRAEEETRRNQAVLEGINRIFRHTIATETTEDLALVCLDVAESITNSEFGFIGQLNEQGIMNDDAISNPGWEACTIATPRGHGRAPFDFKVHGIYGRVMLDGKAFYTNDPGNHPDSIGLPKGHPPLTSFLGVPLRHEGKVIGMFAVGNRKGVYDDDDLRMAEALAPTIAEALRRRKAEDALEDSEERFRTLADNIPILSWMANADGYITWYNKRWYEYTGTTPAEMEGWGWQSVHDPKVLPDVLERWKRSLATGQPFDMVFPLRGADGVFHHFLTRIMPIEDARGKVVRWFGTNTDITTEVETQRDLAQSNEELQQFAYVASHDMQEHLRMITMHLGLLNKRFGRDIDPRAKEHMEYVNSGAERMRQLVNDLLQYSRIESQPNYLAQVDMNKVADLVIKDLRVSIDEANAEVIVEPLPIVMANEHQMNQVLGNLISNAIKFRSDHPPRVEVAAIGNGGEFIFSVKDNGIGIDPKYEKKLFRMFSRLHTKEEYPGTGIGLAISKKIVERHGGRIWVESEAGKGTTFFFTIPTK